MSKETNIETISINWVEYIKASDIPKNADKLDWMEYVIVRTYSAWVFIWYLQERLWKEVVLRKARRIWYWSGANSLSQLAVEWSYKKSECKIAMEVDKIYLTEAIEIIPVTEVAKNNINSIAIWKV